MIQIYREKEIVISEMLMIVSELGLEYSREGARGKMGFLAQIAPFLQSGIGLINFRLRIRLGVSFTSPHSISRGHQEVLVALLLIIEQLFRSLLTPLMGISPLQSEIGTHEITR